MENNYLDIVTRERLISEAAVRVMATAVGESGSPEAQLEGYRRAITNAIDLALGYQFEAIKEDKFGGLEADLEAAVQVAYNRGAVQWAKDNYPTWIDRLEANKKAEEARAKC